LQFFVQIIINIQMPFNLTKMASSKPFSILNKKYISVIYPFILPLYFFSKLALLGKKPLSFV